MTSRTLRLSEPFGVVAYREAGLSHAKSAAPVVLVHGVGLQSAAWGPQLDALSTTHHVIALDMPGHGGSDPLPAGSRLEVFVAWLLAAVDRLGLKRFNLAGHSMGALISGGFAVSHPERLLRVALLNGVFRRKEEARNAVIARAKEIRTGSFDLDAPLTRWFGNSSSEQAAREKVAHWLSQIDIEGYATAYDAFAHGDDTYAEGFETIPCPVLALTGDGDPNSLPAMSQAMADAAPRGRAVIIEKHRHMVNLTAPEAVNAALQEWLQTPSEEMEIA